MSVTAPEIPLAFTRTRSFLSGWYISNSAGVSTVGNSNNFKFPFPEIFTCTLLVSFAFKISLLKATLKLNSPTAPAKFAGFPSKGSALGRIIFLVEANSRLIFFVIAFPKKSARPEGTPITISILIGSIESFPVFVGIRSAF